MPFQVALVRGADAAAGQGFFKATIAALRATLIEACCSAETVHTTWLYMQPAQRPKRPKLEQSPFPPTCRSEYFSPPLLMRLKKDMVGYCVLNKSTDGLHRAGMEAFVVGLFACPARVAGAVTPDLDIGVEPRNAETGHVRHSTMAQSSTSCKTVPPSADHGIGLPATHRSHAVKNCWALKWIRHNRWRQRGLVIFISRSCSCNSSPSRIAVTWIR